jgi:hypothetical protein
VLRVKVTPPTATYLFELARMTAKIPVINPTLKMKKSRNRQIALKMATTKKAKRPKMKMRMTKLIKMTKMSMMSKVDNAAHTKAPTTTMLFRTHLLLGLAAAQL